LTDALMNGRSLWDAFKNYLINTILDGAIKNALSSVIQGGINSMLGSLGINVAGSAASTAAGGAAGGGGLLSAAGSALGVNGAGFTGTGVSGALGIGASAGTGVTTAGVTSGTAVGVDLGLLGSETAAGTAGAGTAGAGTAGVGMGAFSVLGYTAAFFAFASLLHGLAGSKDSVAVGTQDITGMTDKLTRQQETMSGWIDVPIHSVVAQKRRFLDDNSIFYQIFGDGVPLGTVDATDLTKQYGIPAFASGTDYFGGGVRLVGERGPELEVTGPSRIFDAQTTASMLRSGGASNDEVVTELATMRQILMGVLANTRRTANATNGQGEAPMITVVDA
jgi:hypothetical protein